jgi:copper chaperone CopZ
MRCISFIVAAAALIALNGCGSSSTLSSSGPTQVLEGGSSESSLPASTLAEPNTAVLYVNGMGCPLCANNVDKQLLAVKGVENVRVDLGSGQVLARLSPDHQPSREQLAKAVADSGFTLVKIDMPQ